MQFQAKTPGLPLWVSQNYLVNPSLVAHLLDKTSIGRADLVYEIGPGGGMLTRGLAPRCGRLVAVELDGRHCEALRREFRGQRVTVEHGDFLRAELPAGGDYKVVGNVPFAITAEILKKLCEQPNPPRDSYLVLQREAAQKYAGLGRETLRSLLWKPAFRMEVLHRFQRRDFSPAPAVDAVFLHIHRRETPLLPRAQMPLYRDFLAHCFERGAGGLRTLYSPALWRQLAGRMGIPVGATPGAILFIQWLELFRWFYTSGNPAARRRVRGAYAALLTRQAGLEKRHRGR